MVVGSSSEIIDGLTPVRFGGPTAAFLAVVRPALPFLVVDRAVGAMVPQGDILECGTDLFCCMFSMPTQSATAPFISLISIPTRSTCLLHIELYIT